MSLGSAASKGAKNESLEVAAAAALAVALLSPRQRVR
jgi:hypothetical protein